MNEPLLDLLFTAPLKMYFHPVDNADFESLTKKKRPQKTKPNQTY